MALTEPTLKLGQISGDTASSAGEQKALLHLVGGTYNLGNSLTVSWAYEGTVYPYGMPANSTPGEAGDAERSCPSAKWAPFMVFGQLLDSLPSMQDSRHSSPSIGQPADYKSIFFGAYSQVQPVPYCGQCGAGQHGLLDAATRRAAPSLAVSLEGREDGESSKSFTGLSGLEFR